MTDIKKMTDAELVEAVAREVLKFDIYCDAPSASGMVYWLSNERLKEFDPFTDMNDLQMVKDKYIKYVETTVGKWIRVEIYANQYKPQIERNGDNKTRAWLEAALSAERGNINKPDTMVKINGKSFRCDCGCNVFTEASPGHYICNACSAEYIGE